MLAAVALPSALLEPDDLPASLLAWAQAVPQERAACSVLVESRAFLSASDELLALQLARVVPEL